MTLRKTEVAIIGAGISGLSLAYFLKQRRIPLLLLEKADEVGGLIQTKTTAGFLSEAGPSSLLSRPEIILKLSEDIGLGEQIAYANPLARNRFVYRDRALRAITPSPPGILKSNLLSWRGKLRALAEPLVKKSHAGEESIADFVRRRFGGELLDYLVEPMVTGIYAGDPEQLSLQAVLPQLAQLEAECGSVLVGAIQRRQRQPRVSTIFSFASGLHCLPAAIRRCLAKEELWLQTTVEQILPKQHGFELRIRHRRGQSTLLAEQVVIATSAPAAATITRNCHTQLATLLASLPMVSLTSVTLGFANKPAAQALNGFGFLVPKREGLRLLGAIWNSTLFPQRAPDDGATLTCMLGGSRDPQINSLDDETLLHILRQDLETTMALTEKPDFVAIHRWQQAIPQYVLGHAEKIKQLQTLAQKVGALHFTGNYIDGISVPHCVARSESLAKTLALARRDVCTRSSFSVPAQPV